MDSCLSFVVSSREIVVPVKISELLADLQAGLKSLEFVSEQLYGNESILEFAACQKSDLMLRHALILASMVC